MSRLGELATYGGDTYRVAASDWLALVAVVPLALCALALAWLNGRALRRAT